MSDHRAIERLYLDYCRAADVDLEAWPDLFTDDASYQIRSRENVNRGLPLAAMRCDGRGMLLDRVRSIRTSAYYTSRTMRHLIGLLDIGEPDGAGGWTVRASFAVYQSLPREATTLFCAGEYDDLVVATDDGLRFARKHAIYDGDMVVDSFVHPL